MPQPNQSISETIVAGQEQLAVAIVDRQWALYPQLEAKYGAAGHAKCVQDVKYNLSFLAEAIAAGSPALFNHYILWVKSLFAGLNIPVEDLTASLEIMQALLAEQLPPEMGASAAEYIKLSLAELRDAPASLPSFINPQQPHSVLAQQYLDALLQANRQEANRLIQAAVKAGVPVRDIYLHVFQTTQREVGRLWQTNRINVAQEHYCTAATQLIMSQLYPYIFDTKRINHRLVAACVGNELHELGVRMVTDFFEMEGWDTYYLGANVPKESILQAVAEQDAEVLAISATMTFHISPVKTLIDYVRNSDKGRHIKIMVGGYPFNVSPALWQQLGADGYAPDAQAAVTLAGGFVNHGG